MGLLGGLSVAEVGGIAGEGPSAGSSAGAEFTSHGFGLIADISMAA